MQTEMHLGLFHFGEQDENAGPDFRLARHSIDLLAMIEQKTKGNLTTEEQRFLENTLTELRFRFVQALEKSNSAPKPQPPAEPAAAPAPAAEAPAAEAPAAEAPAAEAPAAEAPAAEAPAAEAPAAEAPAAEAPGSEGQAAG
jgi:nucleoid-associated protein YgaU